ncbi:MAG: hypothetical protein IPK52_16975 [Chloroflexi bacterium]|nr:hypothetical protein [Chloroflexota bacterium]
MPWQEGKLGRRGGSAIPNSLQNKLVLEAMKTLKIPATPQNKERVYQAIAGKRPTAKEMVEIVTQLFSGESQASPE